MAVPAAAQLTPEVTAAAPVNGFPNWEERVMHQWMNRARVDPAEDLAGCGSNCSPAEMEPSCYTPQPPLTWDYELTVAARFHSASMALQSFFAHDTPCALRNDIASLYPGSCDGSAACACSGAGVTSAQARVGLFGAGYSGEIAAAGQADPVAAFYGWLHEFVSSTAQCTFVLNGFGDTNGHRYLILKSGGSVGTGYATGGPYGRYYTGDFGNGGEVSKIPSGAHYPQQASSIEFWANWYDAAGPSQARVIIGAVSYPMVLGRGTATNGAWTTTVNGLGSGCHRYYFEFLDSGGQPVRHPSSGTFGIGPAGTCADWVDAVIPPPTLTATALSTSSVQVSWTSSAGASQYELQRSAGNVPFAPLVTTGSTGYADNTVGQGQTYLYRVRPVGGSAWSNLDHATTIAFTDDPLIANVTMMRAVHLTEIRTAVNAAREAAGLGASSWTDASPGGATVKAAHILELRNSLSAALTALGKSATFTNAVSAGMPPRALDFQELRNAVK